MTKKSHCERCGKEFTKRTQTHRYCSHECRGKSRTGKANGRYVAGAYSPEVAALRKARRSADSLSACRSVHDAALRIWERTERAYADAPDATFKDRQLTGALSTLLSEYRQAARLLLEAESAHAEETAEDQSESNLAIRFTAATPPPKTA